MSYDWRKHVRGGRGRGRGDRGRSDRSFDLGNQDNESEEKMRKIPRLSVVRSQNDLLSTLQRIDNKSYKAYHDIEGEYDLNGSLKLFIDHVQSDPFASPSRVRLVVPGSVAGFPADVLTSKIRRTAFCDYLHRVFYRIAQSRGFDVRTETGGWQGKKGGEISIEPPCQHVLERTAVLVHGLFAPSSSSAASSVPSRSSISSPSSPTSHSIEVRFTVALPAQGRSILGMWASEILTSNIPLVALQSLIFARWNSEMQTNMWQHVRTVEDQDALRRMLPGAGLVAFVADGAILPRESGVSDKPRATGKVVPFDSSATGALKTKFVLPNRGSISGLGIKKGVSLLVGGGFHGKSTLLRALEVGVYNHIPGDGREFVVTSPNAVKIRAEDGRAVSSVDISPFINNLPYGLPTNNFSTENASGSTSQAANIIEAIEIGADCLLIDEDTSATNFMIRDSRMQMLVTGSKEPITPFISKIRALVSDRNVSCILVIGGAGDYFEVADHVIMMDAYIPLNVTDKAKAIVDEVKTKPIEQFTSFSTSPPDTSRVPMLSPFCGAPKVKSFDNKISWERDELNISLLEQIVCLGQIKAIADAIVFLANRHDKKGMSLSRMLVELESLLDNSFASTSVNDGSGLDNLSKWRGGGWFIGSYARPRRFELAAVVNRKLQFKQSREHSQPNTASSKS